MTDLYIWEKYKANSSTSTVGTGRYNWQRYNTVSTPVGTGSYTWTKYNVARTTGGSGNFTYTRYTVQTVYEVYYKGNYTRYALCDTENAAKEMCVSTLLDYRPIFQKGAFITEVVAANNSYPINGRHTDGWWYVRGSEQHVSTKSRGSYVGILTAAYSAYSNDAPNPDGYWYVRGAEQTTTSYSKGSYVGTVSGAYSAYSNDARNSDGYWYVRGAEQTTTSTSYSKGSYVGTVTAAYNAYSNNARNSDGYWYVRGGLANKVPTVTLSTEDNKTLYEADTLTISGTATDTDNGNVVTVKYKIAESIEKALTAAVSDGSNAIPFNKQLVFRGGKIYDGETAVTDILTDGNAYTLQVWAEDNQGGKSVIQSRTFHVVPNRAPSLVVNDYDASACIIDSDTFTISGTCEDADGNTMRVGYRINGGDFTEVYNGSDGNWEFEMALGHLQKGTNTITIEAIDSYDFKTTHTVKLNKNTDATQVLNGVARYTINPPSGTAKGILVWIQHHRDLIIDTCSISMTDNAEQENFVQMTHTTTANMPNSTDVLESEFVLETQVPKEKLRLKVEISRASVDVSPAIKLISGVME
ncbi:MAG: hypothetical protein IJX07_06360 [Bacillales bacterium]|nr:hypothetical protein [Bacillales bacterium]